MTLLIRQFSSISCYFLFLRSVYSRQHPENKFQSVQRDLSRDKEEHDKDSIKIIVCSYNWKQFLEKKGRAVMNISVY